MGAPDTPCFRVKAKNQDTYNLYLEGHLFDSQAINLVFNILVDKHHLNCIVVNWVLGKGTDRETSCVIKITESEKFPLAFEEVERELRERNILMKLIDEEYVE